jgi:hypothetical protein
MANVAAHLVDRVLPAVPVRQWVLSLPFELRALAAFRADLISALARHFVESIFARLRGWARRRGLAEEASGAITHAIPGSLGVFNWRRSAQHQPR